MTHNESSQSTTQPAPQRKHKRSRRWRRFTAVFFFISIILLAVLILFRSHIINLLAPAFLTRAGLEEVSFHVQEIGANHVQISYATGLLPIPGGGLRVRLEQVEYDFNYRQLLAGKAERFKVARAELHLPALQAATADTQGKPQPPLFTVEYLFQFFQGLQVIPVEVLRIENLVVHANIAGQNLTTPPLLLEHTATAEGGLLRLQQLPAKGEDPLLAINLLLAGKALQAEIDADLAELHTWLLPKLPFELPLERGRLQVQGRIDQNDQKLRSVQFSFTGTDAGNAAWQAAFFRLALNATSPPGSEDLILDNGSWLSLQGLRSGQIQLGEGQVHLQGKLHVLPNGVQVDWLPQQALSLKGLRIGSARMAAINGKNLSGQATFTKSASTAGPDQPAEKEQAWGRIVLGPQSRFEVQQLTSASVQFENLQAPLNLHIELLKDQQRLQWQTRVPVRVQGLKAGDTAFVPLNFHDLRLQFEKKQTASSLHAELSVPEAGGDFRVQWQSRAAGANQQLTVQTPKALQLNATTSPLQLLAKPPAALADLQVEQGQLRTELHLNWGKSPFTARITVDLRDGTAIYSGMTFSGIKLQQQLQVLPQLRSSKSGTVAVATIKSPIPLNNLTARLQLLPPGKKGTAPSLVIQDGSVRIFDGKVQTNNCRYDSGRSSNTCTFTLHDLDIAKILALHQVDGLSVSGRINGSIPLNLDKTGFSVTEGSLRNSGAGGMVQYQPSSKALKSSPYSEYVLKALEEYHYHSLDASLSYQPDGTLVAGLQLEGRSPKLETDRPVHLNLRAEQNLLSLLKSLQYSQGLTSELNRRVQERFQPGQAK